MEELTLDNLIADLQRIRQAHGNLTIWAASRGRRYPDPEYSFRLVALREGVIAVCLVKLPDINTVPEPRTP